MNPELDGFINAVKSAAVDAQTQFGHLTAEQLNWKPNAEAWSVGQCLEHLIIVHTGIIGKVGAHIGGTYKATVFERLPILPGFFGRFILKSVQPENPSKVKTFRVLDPANSVVGADVVNRFVEHQNKVAAVMAESRNLDSARTIISSPAAGFVVYSLFDAYKIIVTHTRRHFAQARRVMRSTGFPS